MNTISTYVNGRLHHHHGQLPWHEAADRLSMMHRDGWAGSDGDGSSEPPGQSRTTRTATPRAPPLVGAIDAACPQSDGRYRQ